MGARVKILLIVLSPSIFIFVSDQYTFVLSHTVSASQIYLIVNGGGLRIACVWSVVPVNMTTMITR